MVSTMCSKSASFEVSGVRTGSSGSILHLGRFTPPHTTLPSANEKIEQSIDRAGHDLYSRLHTAGQVIGLAVRHLAKSIPDVVELKAQHYPDAAFVEIHGHIDGKHKEAIQAKSDKMVQQNLPVII